MQSIQQNTTHFPSKNDSAIAELIIMDTQVHAVIAKLDGKYSDPDKHQIGHILNMVKLLCHDMEFTADTLYTQYSEAYAAEIEAEQDAQQLL